ncbi:MAG: hypothetical protein KF819_29860 [Labilithrix sp.]|nr:hypothetical protein [Labilithrix sp.]
MILVSKTYWGGMPFWFRRPPDGARVESLALRTHDFRQVRANLWAAEAAKKPRVGVVIIHPRVDFTHHYAVPRLVAAGFAVLAANTRHVHNDTFGEHEEMVLDVDACVRHLKEKRGVDKVVLLGNCGGGSLVALYQAQATAAPNARIASSPGGSPTRFDSAPMIRADAMIYVAAHRGQGKVMLDCIDPAVTDEADALASDPALDMYRPENGFREPPAWSAYDDAYVARHRAGQLARVERLDAMARAHVAAKSEATRASDAEGFAARPESERRDVLRRRAHEPVMVIHRTMANPAFVDRRLRVGADDPTEHDYGSLLSERPDLMNYAALGLARTVTPRAWLSTWSALSSNADLAANVARIVEPTLVVHAARDREVYLGRDVTPVFEACASPDKRLVTIDGARHYFEPEPGERDAPHVEALMDAIVPWIEERLA